MPLEELVHGNKLDKIPTINRKTGKISYLTPEQFEQKYQCRYTASLWGDPAELKEYLTNTELLATISSALGRPSDAAVLERLQNPLQDLAIYDDAGDGVGSGLIALKDIPAGTVLFLFEGCIDNTKHSPIGAEYDYLWLPIDESENKAINATNYRGLTSFSQHLPMDVDKHKTYLKTEITKRCGSVIAARNFNLDDYISQIMLSCTDHELSDMTFVNPTIKDQLATSNMKPVHTIINGIPAVVVITEYGIKQGEMAGFSYGSAYWKGKSPRYFSKNGDLIPADLYTTLHTTSTTRDAVSIQALIKHDVNPLALYTQALANYGDKKYSIAAQQLSQALALFQERMGDNRLECANCYSSLASCQRELGDIDHALQNCKQALTIFSQVDSSKLPKIEEKYMSCLRLTTMDSKTMYDNGIRLYKAKQHQLAVPYLLVALKKFLADDKKAEQATCHSALASCYRELGNHDMAREHCETAVSLGNHVYGPKDARAIAYQQKLAKLTESSSPKSLTP